MCSNQGSATKLQRDREKVQRQTETQNTNSVCAGTQHKHLSKGLGHTTTPKPRLALHGPDKISYLPLSADTNQPRDPQTSSEIPDLPGIASGLLLLLLTALDGFGTSLVPSCSSWVDAAPLLQDLGTALPLPPGAASPRNPDYSREFNLKCSADALSGHVSSESSSLGAF